MNLERVGPTFQNLNIDYACSAVQQSEVSCSVCQNTSVYSLIAKDVISSINSQTTPKIFDVKCSLRPGFQLNQEDENGCHALAKAASCGNIGLIEHLVKKGGKELLNLGNYYGMSALHYAIAFNSDPASRLNTVKKLIELGADVNLVTRLSYESFELSLPIEASPLWTAIEVAKDLDLVNLLDKREGIISPPSELSIEGLELLTAYTKLAQNIEEPQTSQPIQDGMPESKMGCKNQISSIPSTEKSKIISHTFDRQLNSDKFEEAKTFNPAIYLNLQKNLNQDNFPLFIKDGEEKRLVKLGRVLGEGGSKKAYQLENGKVLILPNLDAISLQRDRLEDVDARWTRMANEEVAMSDFLQSIGLLTPNHKKVSISLSLSGAEGSIPAYISDSFESLKDQGIFIIDAKNPKSNTWKAGIDSLFKNNRAQYSDSWLEEGLLDSFLDDLVKLAIYDIPIGFDNCNLAIRKKTAPLQDETENEYEVRFFGFDFSDKASLLSIPDKLKPNYELNENRLKRAIQRFADILLPLEITDKKFKYSESLREKISSSLVQTMAKRVKFKIEKQRQGQKKL